MIYLSIFFALSAIAETWSMQDVQKMMRNPAVAAEDSYLSSLCEVQLEQRRVPTACYREVQKNNEMLRFLNERCAQWVVFEKNLTILKSWSRHPQIHKSCLDKMRERVAELEYVQEEQRPLEYFRSQKAQLAQNLKSEKTWKTTHNPKR